MAAAGGGAARRGLLKRKPNFTLQELEVLMSEVLRYEPLLFGAAAGTVNAYEKQKIWWRITHKVNAAGRHQRDIGEVKNRWRGLRRRAGDKISRHRLERQGPTGRAAARNGNTGSTGNNGSNGNGGAESGPGPAPAPVWCPRGAAGTDPPMRSAEGSAQHGECAGSGGGRDGHGGPEHGHAGPGLGQERTGRRHGDAGTRLQGDRHTDTGTGTGTGVWWDGDMKNQDTDVGDWGRDLLGDRDGHGGQNRGHG